MDETIPERGRQPEPGMRYVRLRRRRPDGFVEFDFGMDDRELFVELVLPSGAYDEFCACNRVVFLEALPDEDAHAEAGPDFRQARLSGVR